MSDEAELERGSDGASEGKAKKKAEAVVYTDVHFNKATTGRSKCAGCGVGLSEGEDRIAKEVNSQHGKIVKSYHPTCGIIIAFNDDNRSKCATCGEKLSKGDYRVKVGCSSKSGPGTKHHYDCLMNSGSNDQARLGLILESKKKDLKEEDRPEAVAGPKKRKQKTDSEAKKKKKKKAKDEEEEEEEDEKGEEA